MRKKNENKEPEKKAVKAEKKAVKKVKTPEIDYDNLEATGTEMASWLGFAPTEVANITATGTLFKNENNKYNLKANVRSYCQRIRTLRAGNNKSKVDVQTAIWKLANIKTKNRDWRMSRDREIALEILKTLTNAMMEIREMAKLNPGLVDEIDRMISAIGSVDVDATSMAVEGNDEEDED